MGYNGDYTIGDVAIPVSFAAVNSPACQPMVYELNFFLTPLAPSAPSPIVLSQSTPEMTIFWDAGDGNDVAGNYFL